MCSIETEKDIEDLTTSIFHLTVKSKRLPEKCNKCKNEQSSVVLRKKDFYCKDCFLTNTLHKFKALLGKHKLLRDNDRVLINYKGGHRTTALLSFLRTSMDMDCPKKLRFQPIGIFVENGVGFSRSERFNQMKKVSEEMKSFEIPIYFTSLAGQTKNTQSDNMLLTENIEEVPVECDNPTTITYSATLDDDIRKIQEKRLLIHAAKKLFCRFIFSLEMSADTASQLLSNVALGRAAHIPLDTGFCDTRDDSVTILRPLRLFDIKELALYNYFLHLEPMIIPQNFKNSRISLQNAIDKFVNEIQSNYPATVTTVLKTGDKLGVQVLKIQDVKMCEVCQGPIETVTNNLTSSAAIHFSHAISNKPRGNQNQLIGSKKYNGEPESSKCFPCSKIALFMSFQDKNS